MAKRVKRLYRAPEKDSVIAGVCAGIANYFEIDPVAVRLLWVVLTFGYGFGILAYLVAWLIMPRA